MVNSANIAMKINNNQNICNKYFDNEIILFI